MLAPAVQSLLAAEPILRTEFLERVERTERPWGWFETVSEDAVSKIKRLRVHPGQQISLQKHLQRAEHWVVVRGLAQVTLGQTVQTLGVGAHVEISLGQVHRLGNTTDEPLDVVEVQWGNYLGEDDIVRLEDTYGRVPSSTLNPSR
jgi:mannose-6-phosphate isomerase-like protein (cupin superfamily)